MDLVYVYKHAGDEREIRYSLRSACLNLEFDRVFIVGDLPRFARGVIHIPFRGLVGKHRDSSFKLFHAAKNPYVSEDFILMNDDFFILRSFDSVPYLYMKQLGNWIKTFKYRSSYYRKALKTQEIVGEKTHIFECHFPIRYNRSKLLALQRKYSLPCGIMTRTLYCFEYGIEGVQSKDYKAINARQLEEYSKKPFMSTSYEAATCAEFVPLMEKLFPEPCRYERGIDVHQRNACRGSQIPNHVPKTL